MGLVIGNSLGLVVRQGANSSSIPANALLEEDTSNYLIEEDSSNILISED